MKQYPSIPRSTGQHFREIPGAYVFDKLDGSNLRFEWNRKRGWYKSGTRTRLFDQSDPDFGEAIPLFQRALVDPVEKVARDERWDQIVVFCEFWGAKSFAGLHEKDDPKRLTLFDVAVYKRGLLGPKDFLKLFGNLQPPLTPRFLGQSNWTRGFVDRVRAGEVEGVTFEGVVGKMGNGRTHDLVMAKAKTQKWVDAVLAKYGAEEGRKIVES